MEAYRGAGPHGAPGRGDGAGEIGIRRVFGTSRERAIMGVKIPTANDIYDEAGRAADQVGDVGEALGAVFGEAGACLSYAFKDIEKAATRVAPPATGRM